MFRRADRVYTGCSEPRNLANSGFRHVEFCWQLLRRHSLSVVFRFCWVAVLLCSSVDAAKADKNVFWPLFDIPPLCIYSDTGELTGLGPNIDAYVQNHLPEYTHSNIVASPLRIMRSAHEGKQWVITGILKSREREKFLYYSKYPCRLTWSVMAVMHKRNSGFIDENGLFPAEDVLDTGDYRLGYVKGIDYGNLDYLIHKYVGNKTISFHSNSFKNQISLLMRGRIDFFFADPLIIFYTSENLNIEDNIRIVPCKNNQPYPIYGYFAVPRTPWGREIMDKIDSILEKAILSGEYRKLLLPWVPEQFVERFNQDYDNGFLRIVSCN